jgi:5,5'-dehydrodivanillate O-demethylase
MSDTRTDRAQRLDALTETGRGTDMGRLLRKFWQPVAVSRSILPGKARALRVMGEDLTLYRGASGKPYLVGGTCAHRRTLLHTGWVQGEEIACMYHGWRYDGSGQCVLRPAEADKGLPPVRIAGYPLRDYCGLVFAYLGEGEAPPFELPRKPVFERPGGIVYAKLETWPCNWFQMVENSLDAAHVSFVHQMGRVGSFGGTVTQAIPELTYLETDAGIRQIATRSKTNVRVSDWTFPNNNHISQPGMIPSDPWIDVGIWMVPLDDTRTARFTFWAVPHADAETDRRFVEYCERYGDYDPADHHDALIRDGKYPDDTLMQLTSAQDYVVQIGQGTIADRADEWLGKSDAGIAFLRRIFLRELEAIRAGRPTKDWSKLAHAAEMPVQVA